MATIHSDLGICPIAHSTALRSDAMQGFSKRAMSGNSQTTIIMKMTAHA